MTLEIKTDMVVLKRIDFVRSVSFCADAKAKKRLTKSLKLKKTPARGSRQFQSRSFRGEPPL